MINYVEEKQEELFTLDQFNKLYIDLVNVCCDYLKLYNKDYSTIFRVWKNIDLLVKFFCDNKNLDDAQIIKSGDLTIKCFDLFNGFHGMLKDVECKIFFINDNYIVDSIGYYEIYDFCVFNKMDYNRTKEYFESLKNKNLKMIPVISSRMKYRFAFLVMSNFFNQKKTIIEYIKRFTIKEQLFICLDINIYYLHISKNTISPNVKESTILNMHSEVMVFYSTISKQFIATIADSYNNYYCTLRFLKDCNKNVLKHKEQIKKHMSVVKIRKFFNRYLNNSLLQFLEDWRASLEEYKEEIELDMRLTTLMYLMGMRDKNIVFIFNLDTFFKKKKNYAFSAIKNYNIKEYKCKMLVSKIEKCLTNGKRRVFKMIKSYGAYISLYSSEEDKQYQRAMDFLKNFDINKDDRICDRGEDFEKGVMEVFLKNHNYDLHEYLVQNQLTKNVNLNASMQKSVTENDFDKNS